MVREYMDKKEKQDHIKSVLRYKTVGIAGVGGLGSNVAISLERCGVNRFVISDFDVVEKSNLNRQYYFLSQIGQKKVEALQDTMKKINHDVACTLITQPLTKGSMWEPFQNVDIVVEALDKAETKTQFIEEIMTYLPNIPLVGASGVAGYGHVDRIRTLQTDRLYMVYDEEALSSNDDVLLAPKVCLMANWQANLVLEILLGDIR
jgi:sulfur carrier protein ThiS adenylyltransferase